MEAGQKMEQETVKHWLLDITMAPVNPQPLWLPVHSQPGHNSSMDWEELPGSTLILD